MTSPNWDRLAELFEQALALPPSERAAFVDAQSADNAWVRDELRAMLPMSDDGAAMQLEHKLLSHDEPADEQTTLPVGTRLGPWAIDAPIGRGGMGEVYRATRADGAFGQTVAIKVMRQDVRSTEAMRRFRAERALLARLSHPSIAAIIDGGTADDGRPYLVMPYVEGLPITRYADTRALDLDARLRLFVVVADAVHHAHVRLIVHRDIKPSNILVTDDGRPMLLDFGIAKLLAPGDDDAALTQTQHRLLTPEHAAPEQVRGEPISTATDVYGLGVLLYELVTGTRPFRTTGRTPGELERAIVHDEPPPASAALAAHAERARERSRVRGDLDRIIAMALRKEPDRRYGSAEQFGDDVRRWLDRLPVRAQRDTLGYRARQFVRRNRTAVVVGASGVLMLAVTGVVATVQARARAVERDRAVLEQTRAEDVLRIFTDLLKQSDPRVLPGGDTMRVKAFLDGADAEIAALEAQPERQLRLRRVMADVRANRGEYARAESLLTTAIARGRTALGPSHLEVIRARHSLARVIAAYRGQSFAAASFDSVVRALRAAPDVGETEVAAAYVDLATATVDPARAQALLDTAVQLRTHQRGDSLTIASTLDAEGEQFFKRGEFAQAATLFRAALRILDARLAPDHFTRLSTLGNLAASENALANWAEAERFASEILQFERKSATGAEGVARALEELAVIHVNLGRYAQAEAEERESIAALRSRKDATHELVDNSLRNLAIMQSAGGKPREGLALLDSVIANRRAAGDSLQVAYFSAQRVPMLLRLGRTAEATATVAAMDALVPTLAPTSRMRGDAAVYSGMAAMAAGRASDATTHLAIATREFDKRYPVSHPRRALAHCAYGAALARVNRREDARTHLVACARHAAWGLADPTVVQWGRAALAP